MADQEKPFKIKIITDVADFGLMQPLARTRARLLASALVANALFVGTTFLVADHINNASASVSLNMVLITVTMLLMLAASYLDAMVAGDLFFPGNWRERVLLGQRMKTDSAEALDVENHRNFNFHFLVVLAFIIVGNYFGMQALAGDFLDEYHELGFHLTRLRAQDDAEKVAAFKELSKNIYAERCHESRVSAAILAELDNPDLEVRRWAMYTVRQARLSAAYPKLVAQLDRDDDLTRAEAAISLGRLGDKRAVPHLARFLEAAADSPQRAVGALRALAVLEDPEGAPAAMTALDNPDPQVRAHAAWTLGKLHHNEAYDRLMARYEDPASTPLDRCAALEGLFRIPREADIQKIKDIFLLGREDPACDYIIWEEYNGDKTYVMYKESHRAKLLRFVANAVGVKERDWFTYVASDQDRPYELRLLASQIIQEIDRQP